MHESSGGGIPSEREEAQRDLAIGIYGLELGRIQGHEGMIRDMINRNENIVLPRETALHLGLNTRLPIIAAVIHAITVQKSITDLDNKLNNLLNYLLPMYGFGLRNEITIYVGPCYLHFFDMLLTFKWQEESISDPSRTWTTSTTAISFLIKLALQLSISYLPILRSCISKIIQHDQELVSGPFLYKTYTNPPRQPPPEIGNRLLGYTPWVNLSNDIALRIYSQNVYSLLFVSLQIVQGSARQPKDEPKDTEIISETLLLSGAQFNNRDPAPLATLMCFNPSVHLLRLFKECVDKGQITQRDVLDTRSAGTETALHCFATDSVSIGLFEDPADTTIKLLLLLDMGIPFDVKNRFKKTPLDFLNFIPDKTPRQLIIWNTLQVTTSINFPFICLLLILFFGSISKIIRKY